MTFAQNGEPPLAPAVPILVADFEDLYERGADGRLAVPRAAHPSNLRRRLDELAGRVQSALIFGLAWSRDCVGGATT